ncbi:hypothetical protein BofuT4_P034920.1 [Botrytis cinerea T4]|uniref:Uncharacterized protein n=1 Tax=Botryotinia fuckeliana (strain T4) TaxID=999810 RepID=G2Y6E7_BOTF4|nr:hypothetical protein BofuT4_P034920.1 [Botrytis cinerea T4]
MKKKKRFQKLVRRPSTPTPIQTPKRTKRGSRSSPLSIQIKSLLPGLNSSLLAERNESKNGFTLGHRGSAHRPSWSLWLL